MGSCQCLGCGVGVESVGKLNNAGERRGGTRDADLTSGSYRDVGANANHAEGGCRRRSCPPESKFVNRRLNVGASQTRGCIAIGDAQSTTEGGARRHDRCAAEGYRRAEGCWAGKRRRVAEGGCSAKNGASAVCYGADVSCSTAGNNVVTVGNQSAVCYSADVRGCSACNDIIAVGDESTVSYRTDVGRCAAVGNGCAVCYGTDVGRGAAGESVAAVEYGADVCGRATVGNGAAVDEGTHVRGDAASCDAAAVGNRADVRCRTASNRVGAVCYGANVCRCAAS